jgi:hypothetical protein
MSFWPSLPSGFPPAVSDWWAPRQIRGLNIEDAVSYGERGDGTERDVDDGEQDEADPLGLSEGQADTNRLLRQLLGTAIKLTSVV